MIVVSNTSPITNLAAIGKLDLIRKLYGKIYIPNAVWNELHAYGKSWPGTHEVENAAWILQTPAQNQILSNALQRDLDQGEAESLALALDIKADLLIIDEKEGRHAAARLGIKVIGVIGILIEAHSKNEITDIRTELDMLRQQAGFYISDKLYQSVLQQIENF